MTEKSLHQNEQPGHLQELLAARAKLVDALVKMTATEKDLAEWVKKNAKRNDDKR